MKIWLSAILIPLWSSYAYCAFQIPCGLLLLKDQPIHERYIGSYVRELNTLEYTEKKALVWIGIELINFGSLSRYDRSLSESVIGALLRDTTKEDWLLIGAPWMSQERILALSDDSVQFTRIFLDALEDRMPFQKGAGWTGNIFTLIRNLISTMNKYRI